MLHRPTPESAGLGLAGLVILIALGCTLLPMAAAGGASASTGAAFTVADAQTRDKVLQDIQTANDAFIEAFNNRRVETLMRSLAEDMIAMQPGEPAIVGAEAMGNQYDQATARGIRIQALKERDERIWTCGDLICAAGRYTLTLKMPDASTPAESRRGVAIWQRQKDGSLKLKLDAYNRLGSPDSPPAQDKPTVYRCTADSPTLPADAALYDQIRDLEKRFERLFIDNKRAEALGWYADDATLMTGDYVFQGKAELKTLLEQDPGHHAMQDIELKFAHVEGNEQMVYVVKWCGWKMKNPVSGMDYIVPGKSLHVWQHQPDGSWKIILDLNNMDIML